MTVLAAVLHEIDSARPATLQRLVDLLRIPSISAQPDHAPDCQAAAQWLCQALTEIGFTAQVRPTPGQPIVVAHHPGTGGPHPHVLFYGHYDVQPADPVEAWTSAPFDPAIVEGPHGQRVVARGAVDDKGQLMMWLEALRAWHKIAGGPPVPVTVLIEGEEETGSLNLESFLKANKTELRADIAVISDTNMWDIRTPAITTRLRGLLYTQIDLTAASRDLHSGLYGGSALNPLNLLTRILGQLHDAHGRVALPGFYDHVAEIPPAQAASWHGLAFDEAQFLGEIGLSHPAGEQDRPGLQRLWSRPTADINGVWGGYTGQGGKTVIPSQAHAKLSFRLVPGQDPAQILRSLQDFITTRLPADAKVNIRDLGAAPGVEVPCDSPAIQAACAALQDEYGRPPVLIGSGGSIPVVESLKRLLGVDSLLMGFGLNDDQIHSPNEKFELTCLHHGARSHARLLSRLAGHA